MKKTIFILIILVSSTSGYDLPEELETYLDLYSSESMDDEILKELEKIHSGKPSLSSLSDRELSHFFWLDSYQKKWILKNRPKSIQILEDSLIITDRGKLELLSMFVKEHRPGTVSRSPGQLELASRWYSKNPAIPDTSYEGGNYNLYSEFYGEFGKYEVFACTEKDLHERNLADYSNFNLLYKKTENLYLIAGKHQVNWGQGLVLRQGFAFDYFLDNPHFIKKSDRTISPYRGTSENNGMNGIALRWSKNKLNFETTLSVNKYDANFDGENDVTSFNTTGYHRNPKEEAKKDYLEEKLVGSRLRYTPGNFKLAASFYFNRYSPAFTDSITYRKEFDFKGDNNFVYGLDYEYLLNNFFEVFGEAAFSGNGGEGFLLGIMNKGIDYKIALQTRYYSRDFQNFHSGAYSSQSEPRNEKGISIAFLRKISGGHKLSLFLDSYFSIDRTYTYTLPINEKRIQGRYKSGKSEFYYRFKNKTFFDNDLHVETDENEHIFRLTFRKKLSKKWKTQLRVEYKTIPSINSEGILVSIKNSFRLSGIEFLNSVTRFNTDDWYSRIYLYVNDLPGMWNVPSFYDQGYHVYQLINIRLNSFAFKFKIGSTIYPERKTMTDGRSSKTFNYYGIYFAFNPKLARRP